MQKANNRTNRKGSKSASSKEEEEKAEDAISSSPTVNHPGQQKTVLSPELLKKLVSQSRNGSLLLLMLNSEGRIAQENGDDSKEALTRTTLTPPLSSKKSSQVKSKLFGVGSSFSNAQLVPIPIELAAHGQDQQIIGGGLQPIFLADSNWLNGLSLSHSPAIQLLYAEQQQQSHTLNTPASTPNNNPAFATLAPPTLPPHLLPTPPPYTPPTLLSEFAPVTTTVASGSSTKQPEAYVKDLTDLGEDYDSGVGAKTTGRPRGDSVEEEYEDQQVGVP
jgi:hypothetical protein